MCQTLKLEFLKEATHTELWPDPVTVELEGPVHGEEDGAVDDPRLVVPPAHAYGHSWEKILNPKIVLSHPTRRYFLPSRLQTTSFEVIFWHFRNVLGNVTSLSYIMSVVITQFCLLKIQKYPPPPQSIGLPEDGLIMKIYYVQILRFR